MVDMHEVTSQFHPYQPPAAQPHVEESVESRLGGFLRRNGVSESSVRTIESAVRRIDLQGRMSRLRFRSRIRQAQRFARRHPAQVAGGLAAVAIGAGLLGRSMHHRNRFHAVG
ncbi:MAG: hypothetical protein WBX15_09455 [Thermoanaerobaculia bacterium]